MDVLKWFMMCDNREVRAIYVQVEVFTCPENGKCFSFCLRITLLDGVERRAGKRVQLCAFGLRMRLCEDIAPRPTGLASTTMVEALSGSK